MGKHNALIIKEDLSSLRNHLKQQNTLIGEKRLKCLIYLKENKFGTQKALANYLGIHQRTLERWLNKYSEFGLEAMIRNEPKPKRSKYITEEIHKALEARVTNGKTPFLGYWDAKNWVLIEFGVDVHYQALRRHLIKHFGTKIKSPRKSHYKKDGQATEAFLKTT